MDSAKKSLDQATKAKEAHENDIEELRKQVAEIEEEETEYLERTASESQSQGQDITLQDSQVNYILCENMCVVVSKKMCICNYIIITLCSSASRVLGSQETSAGKIPYSNSEAKQRK